MQNYVLDFEKPIVEIEKKIQELRQFSLNEDLEIHKEIERLESKAKKIRKDVYAKLTRWQRYQLAKHPDRPYTLDYIHRIFTDFVELHGDRAFADDPAMVAGFAKLGKRHVVVVGQQKARDTKEKIRRNFGMASPEGYRKALRMMKMAEKFGRPIITLVDTPGAYPGLGAEERGQGEAIARNLLEMSHIQVPIIVVVIGEGASGGALGIGVGDRVLMMENSWYSVISPEGCASILFRDSTKAELAAEAMKITAPDLLEMGLIDDIIKEPIGGAHSDYDQAAANVAKHLNKELDALVSVPRRELVAARIDKFGKMGEWKE